MATTVSAWGKPGAWALESEEHEAMEVLRQQEVAAAPPAEPSADFPSLAAAAATKIPKKKKGQTISLAEFNNGGVPVTHGSAKFQVRSLAASGSPLVPSKGLTHDERLMLPTAPRERTAEELELGNSRGFNSYGGGRSRMNGEDSVSRWDSSRVSDEGRRNGFGSGGPGSNRDLAPSRADEIDDWGANKRSVAPPADRRERTGGFFESQSRADDLDSWVSNKSAPPPLPDSRRTGDGFRERRGFDMFTRDAPAPNGSGDPDSESWGRKKEDAGGERPRLRLQPRTLPLANGDGEQVQGSKSSANSPFGAARPREEVLSEKGQNVSNDNGDHREEVKPVPRSKGLNPFGAARPREEVLAEKGQDWKEIDERLESMKIREVASLGGEGQPFSKKGFGLGVAPGSQPGDKTEKTWRKMDPVESPTSEQRFAVCSQPNLFER